MSRDRIELDGPPAALFGDGRQGVWGLVLGGASPTLILATGSSASPVDPAPVRLDLGETWEITSEGDGTPTVALTISPELGSDSGSSSGRDSDSGSDSGSGSGPHEIVRTGGSERADDGGGASGQADLRLGRVQGRISAAGGNAVELDAAGVMIAALPSGGFDSARALGAWFPDGTTVGLLASRPQRPRGHDRDEIVACLKADAPDFAGQGAAGRARGAAAAPESNDSEASAESDQGGAEEIAGKFGTEATTAAEPAEPSPTGPLQIFEPLLSTTYDGDGAVRKMSLELWMGHSEDGEQYPRRFAGERVAPILRQPVGRLFAEAFALHCHGRDGDGLGIYLLLRPGA